MYDLNQIPYDYTVEVRNKFKGLDLIDRVPNELWNEVRDIVQETGIKTIPMEKKCKKAKEFQKNIYFCFIDSAENFDCVDHNKLENSERDGNTRPPHLSLEKSICRLGSNS